MLQFTTDWLRDNMATVTSRRKVRSVEGKFKVIRETEDGRKKAEVFREFGLSILRPKRFGKNRTKVVSALGLSGQRMKRFRKV